jgi:aryl-alcohol dehydrogenase-like predicted oxidoreductase
VTRPGNHRVIPDGNPPPGTIRVERLEENSGALEVALTAEDLFRIDAAFPAGAARGDHYSEQAMRALNR